MREGVVVCVYVCVCVFVNGGGEPRCSFGAGVQAVGFSQVSNISVRTCLGPHQAAGVSCYCHFCSSLRCGDMAHKGESYLPTTNLSPSVYLRNSQYLSS